MHAHITALLQQFTQSMGIADFALNAEGYACLEFDELLVNFEHVDHTDTLLIYAVMGTVPPIPTAALYAQLLEANFFFNGTAGATLGLDKEAGLVVLTQVLECNGKSPEMFERCVESFVNVAQQWSQTLLAAHLQPASADAAAAAAAPSAPHADLGTASWIRG